MILGVVLGACTASGPVDNPGARKLTWFSYVSGDDLKARCADDGFDRIRLVYNAIYREHVRTYDIILAAGAAGSSLSARAIEAANLAEGVGLDDPFGPWNGVAGEAPLTAAEALALQRSLRASGLTAPPPVGLRLPGRSFHWTAAACLDGRFHFTAWLYPSDRFAALTFPAVVADLDPVAVPMPSPHEVREPLPGDARRTPDFEMLVGRDGLAGRLPGF